LGVAVGILALTGCGERRTAFNMVTIDPTGASERFHETFDECYFSVSPHRRVDVIARRVIETGPDEPPISQLVHLRTAYRIHARGDPCRKQHDQRDGSLCVRRTTCYGAGHLSTHESRDGRVMTGKLEHAQVTRNRHIGQGGDIFVRAKLRGGYHAVRNRRKVVAMLNEINRLLGPQPDYTDQPTNDPL
jgi:hypothetical protein